jgi:hypothetical protein
VGCGETGVVAVDVAASSLVDGGGGTTLSRRRLVGAKTPWVPDVRRLTASHGVRFAYVGGIRGTSYSSNSTPVITSFRRPSGRARFTSFAKRPSAGGEHEAHRDPAGVVNADDLLSEALSPARKAVAGPGQRLWVKPGLGQRDVVDDDGRELERHERADAEGQETKRA